MPDFAPMRSLAAMLACCCFLTACGPTTVYERHVEIADAEWTYADSLQFAFSITDTSVPYDYLLTLEHGPDFPTQNLYVKLHTGFPSGKRESQQLSLQLADNFGQWYGDCGGKRCRIEIPILRRASFSTAGDYSLTVEQYGRENPLQDIHTVGLRVVVAE